MLIKSTHAKSSFWRGMGWLGLSGLALGTLVFLAPSSWASATDAGNGDSDQTRVRGNLTAEQVNAAAFRAPYQGMFIHECYSQLSPPRANLHFRSLFEINADGRVGSAHVEVPEHPELAPCLESVLKRIEFPKPSSGTVQVDLPGMLSPPLQERNERAQADHGTGRLSIEEINQVVQAAHGRFGACYEALPKPLPTVNMRMDFTIGLEGKVIDSLVESKEHPKLASCVDGVVRSLVFPVPRGGIVTVGYPLVMSPDPPADAVKPAPGR